MKETLFVSFSGGRTSAYMCWYLLKYWGHIYNFIFVFANTGLEHEETLIFVDRCDKAFGLNLIYVEAVVNPEKGKGIRHKIINFTTAARKGEPFREYIAKEGIPNAGNPKCTDRLKQFVMESYKRSIGFRSKHLTAVGYRADEIDRMSEKAEKDGLIYPLISWQHTTKPEVNAWWAERDFNLELTEEYGNCVTCWKKSDRKLMTIAKHHPEYFDFNIEMEREMGSAGPSGHDNIVFFRGKKSALDIIASSKKPFKEFKETKPELQLRLITDGAFEIDPLDIESDCGAGCEI